MWNVVAVDAPQRLVFDMVNPDLPTIRCVVTFEPRAAGGTTMTLSATFSSPDAMDELLGSGSTRGCRRQADRWTARLRDP